MLSTPLSLLLLVVAVATAFPTIEKKEKRLTLKLVVQYNLLVQ